ncbi:unnamed protein product [Ixodes persulcatus]
MREHCAIRLVQAYAISRITYVAPYLKWLASERNKVECMIRKAFKRAVGVPVNASTDRFLDLGLHNTLSLLIEAHDVAQYERLSKSKTSRRILESLGITYHTQCGEKTAVPSSVRDRLIVPPLPKNMHPTHHVGRRNRRASDLQRRFGKSDEAVYVDAARYGERRRSHSIAVVNRTGNCIASATVRTGDTEAAEEAAIALALVAAPDAAVVISDSQAAVRGFARGPSLARSGPHTSNSLWRRGQRRASRNDVVDVVVLASPNRKRDDLPPVDPGPRRRPARGQRGGPRRGSRSHSPSRGRFGGRLRPRERCGGDGGGGRNNRRTATTTGMVVGRSTDHVQGHHPTPQIKQTQIPATTRQAKQNRGRNLEITANAHLPQPGDPTPLLPEPIPDGRV